MKASIFSIAAAVGLASAQYAFVENHCDKTVWVQSYPYDGQAPGAASAVEPGKSWQEPFRYQGSTVKISKSRNFDDALQYGYSFTSNPNLAYYEFSNEHGNPWADKHNTLSAGSGCDSFDCAPNDYNCYSKGGSKVLHCPQPLNITAQICV
ncbi:16 kDa allergen [Beauveria brongniartii RCEF 3172]|uniref:16 kDa allergen n=1 Tax=Beauveria brongniartii RCEF 3172 TaxID=1081107 RepID=A0A167H4Q7_9HYPO|nr:16 kDa allergen [Beauveria brongniartii RCEF 3172]